MVKRIDGILARLDLFSRRNFAFGATTNRERPPEEDALDEENDASHTTQRIEHFLHLLPAACEESYQEREGGVGDEDVKAHDEKLPPDGCDVFKLSSRVDWLNCGRVQCVLFHPAVLRIGVVESELVEDYKPRDL